MLAFRTRAHSVHGQFPEMLRIVVIACGEGVKTSGKAVDGIFESDIIVIGE